MIINFKTLSGQQHQLDVSEDDTVIAVKEKLIILLNENGIVKKAEQIKLYCGNDKMSDAENFLQLIPPHIKKVHIRLKKPTAQSLNKQNSIQFSFFGSIKKSFANTTLTTDPSYDLLALQRGKGDILTTGAIPRDAVALTGSKATIETDKGSVIDLSSMTLNCILGINDPWVKLRQTSYLLSEQPHFVTIRMGFPIYYSYAKRLSALLSDAGFKDAVINHRQCNGSDAVELAIHAAFVAADPSRKKIAAFRGSYHGQNLTATIVSEHQPSRFLIDQPSEVEFFASPTYGTKKSNELSEVTQKTLDILRERGEEFFAVLIEPLQVRNAVHQCPIEFLRELRKICTEKNICLIFDEIQTGFGWLGKLCMSDSHNINPDIAVFSKAVTSGHGALAVMVANKKYNRVSSTFSGKTNAGEALSLIAADAVLDRLYGIPKDQIPGFLPDDLKSELENGLLSRVPEISTKLFSLLGTIKERFPSLTGEIKGQGLVRGLEIMSSNETNKKLCAWLINRAYENGVYLRQAEHVIIFKPSIVTTDSELSIALVRLCKTFQEGAKYLDECIAANQSLVVAKSHL